MEFVEKKELHRLTLMFKNCGPIFVALGDENRQKLVVDIAESGNDGLNVTNLAKRTHLSRPAISHHLKVLKDCGLISPVKAGTQIFYQLTLRENLDAMSDLITSIQKVLEKFHSGSGAPA